MSKTKTKRARRELKREGNRKIAAHRRKIEKATAAASSKIAKPTSTATTKKQKGSTRPTKPQTPSKPAMQASQQHAMPFGTYDHILLVGEGDFSFTKSLVVDHGCANVTATSYDSAEAVQEKYPGYSSIHAELSALSPPVPIHHGIDATKLSSYKALRCKRDDDNDSMDGENEEKEGWDTIAFQFPHTGGLSTDVNRQVRANQALLVSFFRACLDTHTPAKRLQILQSQQRNSSAPRVLPFLRMGGRVIVTLFEGDPYSLWNIRDLARHAGLRVVESWKFDWAQYPAYGHVRTLGTIEGGGAWRGEDREARMYVFEKVPLVADSDEEKEMEKLAGKGKGKAEPQKEEGRVARKRVEEESSDDED